MGWGGTLWGGGGGPEGRGGPPPPLPYPTRNHLQGGGGGGGGAGTLSFEYLVWNPFFPWKLLNKVNTSAWVNDNSRQLHRASFRDLSNTAKGLGQHASGRWMVIENHVRSKPWKLQQSLYRSQAI